jgi:hypothetical protein
MRRALSILLILFFGLGPLAATLPAADESRLPPCCRRHGAHHCTMTMGMVSQAASENHGFTASSRCSRFPGYPAASTAPMTALAAAPVRLPAPFTQSHSIAASHGPASLHQIGTRAGRGPPTASIG